MRKLSEDVTSAQVFSKLANTDSGVPRGANMPFKPGTPAEWPSSAMVGTSGYAKWRCSAKTANGRTPLPAMPEIDAAEKVISLLINCGRICGSPLNGTWTASSPAVANQADADRCGTDPTPVVPQLNLPGCDLPAATNSWYVL